MGNVKVCSRGSKHKASHSVTPQPQVFSAAAHWVCGLRARELQEADGQVQAQWRRQQWQDMIKAGPSDGICVREFSYRT
jgi:hypothetical protein